MSGTRKQAMTLILILIAILLPLSMASAETILADHYSCAAFDLIPDSVIEDIGTDYDIYYVHTSHGSQIMTGIAEVYAEDNFYDPPPFHEVSDDLGGTGDTTWAPGTRTYLDAHPECNMAMFSWCGGCSDNTEAGINIYLAKMEELEADYPGVIFIYMTGHLDGTGIDGNLYARNNQIRAYCNANDKILFDFADIESYDPDGNYYPDETDYCNWCTDWCATHTCPECGCAHSQCFNCYQKGKAWWWMMARISGWNSTEYACGDTNGDGLLTVSDVSYINGYLFQGYPEPYGEADVDECGSVNIFDAVYILDYLFSGGPAPCEGSVDCDMPAGENAIILGCPVEAYGYTGDSVAIPVYLRSDTALQGFSCGFQFDSDDIEITSVDITGSVIDPTWGGFYFNAYSFSSADYGRVNIGWCENPPFVTPMPAQDSGLLFMMWAQIPIGTAAQTVDFDTISSFITNPPIEFILSPVGGGVIKPAYIDCGADDLLIIVDITICGDANGDLNVNVSDAVFIINYVFVGGDPPSPLACGDANEDCSVGVSDAVWIINYVFVGGPPPDDCCPGNPGWVDGDCGPFVP
jgi:hypothetical protein